MDVVNAASKSNPNTAAGARAGDDGQTGAVEVQVVGAGALNQAVKAIAIARGYVAPSGVDLICVPTFADIEIDGESRTAIRLLVEDRERRVPVAVSTPATATTTVDLRDHAPADNGGAATEHVLTS